MHQRSPHARRKGTHQKVGVDENLSLDLLESVRPPVTGERRSDGGPDATEEGRLGVGVRLGVDPLRLDATEGLRLDGLDGGRGDRLPGSETHHGLGRLRRVVGEGLGREGQSRTRGLDAWTHEGDEELESKIDDENEEGRERERDGNQNVEQLGDDLGDGVRNRVYKHLVSDELDGEGGATHIG
jgi:hypothetical protein